MVVAEKHPEQAPAVPTGVELTALDDAFRRDPYAVLKRLRDAEPVHHDDVLHRWVLTRHDDVDRVINDRTMSSIAMRPVWTTGPS